jgi:hypothetical protein
MNEEGTRGDRGREAAKLPKICIYQQMSQRQHTTNRRQKAARGNISISTE